VSTARFKVTGRFDGATSATIEIDRDKGLVHVRPHRRHETATVTLAWVAEAVLWQAAKASAAAKRAR
jgi:hypothetical protein